MWSLKKMFCRVYVEPRIFTEWAGRALEQDRKGLDLGIKCSSQKEDLINLLFFREKKIITEKESRIRMSEEFSAGFEIEKSKLQILTTI